jgi:hypothetical protein
MSNFLQVKFGLPKFIGMNARGIGKRKLKIKQLLD